MKLLDALDTDARQGLSEKDASSRLHKYGRNELAAEKPLPRWRKFLSQFQNVLVILLPIATAIFAGQWLYEQAFSTVSLSLEDWLFCIFAASSVLWLSKLLKLVIRLTRRI